MEILGVTGLLFRGFEDSSEWMMIDNTYTQL